MGNTPGPQHDFVAYLRSIPQGGEFEFPRSNDLPRKADL
jgi:hypothetical protein